MQRLRHALSRDLKLARLADKHGQGGRAARLRARAALLLVDGG